VTTDRDLGTAADADTADACEGGTMRARRWCIAATFHDPADYDIPELPDWTVYRDEDGTLALGEGGERLLSAGSPVRVRR
jgi:hypothetical protein